MTHPLESNLIERARWNMLTDTTTRAAWRRVTEALTGGLPSWAERRKNGAKVSFDANAAVAMYNAGGVTLQAVADHFGVVPQAVGYHVRKAKAAEAARA